MERIALLHCTQKSPAGQPAGGAFLLESSPPAVRRLTRRRRKTPTEVQAVPSASSCPRWTGVDANAWPGPMQWLRSPATGLAEIPAPVDPDQAMTVPVPTNGRFERGKREPGIPGHLACAAPAPSRPRRPSSSQWRDRWPGRAMAQASPVPTGACLPLQYRCSSE